MTPANACVVGWLIVSTGPEVTWLAGWADDSRRS